MKNHPQRSIEQSADVERWNCDSATFGNDSSTGKIIVHVADLSSSITQSARTLSQTENARWRRNEEKVKDQRKKVIGKNIVSNFHFTLCLLCDVRGSFWYVLIRVVGELNVLRCVWERSKVHQTWSSCLSTDDGERERRCGHFWDFSTEIDHEVRRLKLNPMWARLTR